MRGRSLSLAPSVGWYAASSLSARAPAAAPRPKAQRAVRSRRGACFISMILDGPEKSWCDRGRKRPLGGEQEVNFDPQGAQGAGLSCAARGSRRRAGMGPLQGVKIIEIAGIGPGPFAAMMLADMGAEVLRIDRAQNVPASPPEGAELRSPEPRAAEHRHRSQAGAGRRDGAAPRRAGRRAARRLPAGRDGAARPRTRGLPRAQPAARLRAHDGLGAGGADRAGRRARHQLHRAGGRAASPRARGREAAAAAQPGRRLRRRRHAAGVRRGVRAGGARSARARARWSTPRWSTARPC